MELKATAFKPEHTGQRNFYLAAVDAELKAPDDKPTIGRLLCKPHDRLVAEYQLLRELPAEEPAHLCGNLG